MQNQRTRCRTPRPDGRTQVPCIGWSHPIPVSMELRVLRSLSSLALSSVALSLLVGLVAVIPAAKACEKHLDGHQASSDSQKEAATR